jgi:hypothetical protein
MTTIEAIRLGFSRVGIWFDCRFAVRLSNILPLIFNTGGGSCCARDLTRWEGFPAFPCQCIARFQEEVCCLSRKGRSAISALFDLTYWGGVVSEKGLMEPARSDPITSGAHLNEPIFPASPPSVQKIGNPVVVWESCPWNPRFWS